MNSIMQTTKRKARGYEKNFSFIALILTGKLDFKKVIRYYTPILDKSLLSLVSVMMQYRKS